ncbi:MAG: hypothetical protein EZS28_038442 [Streblomastix strix]|uniref:Uncharacterized protein n=1 Tax=Streblomastix strix TaxID=222440 RepID=A0A5J4U802_9EUKA|nr:MAG: hypothetical protein EZS28_038442 [Streblomastix strix]
MIIIEEALPKDKFEIILEFILKLVKNSIESRDDFIVWNGIRVYQKFLISEADFQGEGKLIQLRQRFVKDKTLNQLLKIFLNKPYKNEMIVNNAAIAIGYIYKAMRIPDEFGEAIIKHNKVIISQPYIFIPVRALVGLGYLAECQDNHQQILANNFLQNISDILVDDKQKEQQFVEALTLLIKLFKYGTQETKELILDQIKIPRIESFTQHYDNDISTKALALLKEIEEEKMSVEDKKELKKCEHDMKQI